MHCHITVWSCISCCCAVCMPELVPRHYCAGIEYPGCARCRWQGRVMQASFCTRHNESTNWRRILLPQSSSCFLDLDSVLQT